MSTDFHNFFTDIFTRKLGEVAGNSMTNCFLAHNLQMKMQIKLAYFQHHAEKDALSIPLLRLQQFWPNAFTMLQPLMQVIKSKLDYTTHLVHKILGHLAKNVGRYFRHSVRIFADKPQYAGSSHWHGDGVSQLSHVTNDFIVGRRLHVHKQQQIIHRCFIHDAPGGRKNIHSLTTCLCGYYTTLRKMNFSTSHVM